jgi:hypothetical protein
MCKNRHRVAAKDTPVTSETVTGMKPQTGHEASTEDICI